MDKTQTCSEPLQAAKLQPKQVPAITPPRKRQIESDIDEPRPKRARLTRKNLARFNKMGKKDSKKTSTHHSSSTESQKTKTTSTTTSGFAAQARKNGILPPPHSKPPTNLEDIQKRHARSRETASPTESAFKHYANNVEKAGNEATMVTQTSRHMLKHYDEDEGYNQSFDRSFTGFPRDLGFNDGLSTPQPDFVEGLEVAEYDPVPVDEHVDGAVLYDDDPYSITLPHLAGEWKGKGKDMNKARLQSSYDGAALVYARNQALSYMGKSDPPGHAEVTTFTTDGTNLNHYAHYADKSEDGTVKYHQYQYASTNVKDSYQGHKDGRRGLRNAQDHARSQSYALKDQLKEHWKQHRGDLQPIAEGTSLPVPDSQANAYEDTNSYKVGYGTSACEETNPYQTGYGRSAREETNPYQTGYGTTACEETNPYQTGYGTSTHEETNPYQTGHGTNAYEETAPYEDEAGYEIVDQPHSKHRSSSRHSSGHSSKHSPPQHLSSKHSSSKHSSTGHSSTHSSTGHSSSKHSSSKSSHHAPSSDGHKRKASQPSLHGSSEHASKHRSYWKQDPETGYYYHKHSDGRVSWLNEGDDDEEY